MTGFSQCHVMMYLSDDYQKRRPFQSHEVAVPSCSAVQTILSVDGHAIHRDVGAHFSIVAGSTKVCSLHFREEDYRQPSARTLARRKQKLKGGSAGSSEAADIKERS